MATPVVTVAGCTIYQSGNALVALSGLEVDGDGANGQSSLPCYAPGGMASLDYLANAGAPGNWWGIAVDADSNPYIQTAQEPAPGAYVSTTATTDPRFNVGNPGCYVDASSVPFIVIPSLPRFGARLGNVGFALRLDTGDSTEFIVADIGPANQFGEASVKAASNLSYNSSPKDGGTSNLEVLYLIFPWVNLVWPCTQGAILSAAYHAFLRYGEFDQLKAEFPQFDLSQF